MKQKSRMGQFILTVQSYSIILTSRTPALSLCSGLIPQD